jgi:hypothetical protein
MSSFANVNFAMKAAWRQCGDTSTERASWPPQPARNLPIKFMKLERAKRFELSTPTLASVGRPYFQFPWVTASFVN